MKDKAKKLLILTSYFKDESYGLLGPQMAATLINDHTDFDARVVGITNEDDTAGLQDAIHTHLKDQPVKIVGFSSLGGRTDLFDLARALKQKGYLTLLAGPQAGPDFLGETGWQSYPHRFQGVSDHFCFALQGPAQQILPILASGPATDLSGFDGVLVKDQHDGLLKTPPLAWDDAFLSRVDWKTLWRLRGDLFEPVTITCAQVLQQIGCPHAARQRQVSVDYPEKLAGNAAGHPAVTIGQRGCSFCDVATDKGFMGALGASAVRAQLDCLPRGADGRKIAFELINENPLPGLSKIFEMADDLCIRLSQINLTLRADYLLSGISHLEAALDVARKNDIRILLSSIGFESFDDTILKNLNKGVTRQQNLNAIKAIRELKQKYPAHLGYLREEGANHGFIHPTPWDSAARSQENNRTISMYQLALDILPSHSTPLIIHHASGLADWIRQIELIEDLEFKRHGTTIAWWQTKDRMLL